MQLGDEADVEERRIPNRGVTTERAILREVLTYKGARSIVGRTSLEVATLSRQAHLWTFDDGEHVLLLVELHRFRHWVATRDSYNAVHAQACEWLTEPPASRSKASG